MIEELTACLIEDNKMIDARNRKLMLIDDVYKLERLIGRKQTCFFTLYDADADILMMYIDILTQQQMSIMLPNRGLSRH